MVDLVVVSLLKSQISYSALFLTVILAYSLEEEYLKSLYALLVYPWINYAISLGSY